MTAISTTLVKELRERTGLGMLECKKALKEANGDIELAIEELRKSSGMKAAKKAGRIAAEGAVAVRVADDNKRAMIVEVNSETDFVARDAGFQAFVAQVADKAFAAGGDDVAAVMAGELESAREALVQKIGENIGVRRIASLQGDVIDAYVHAGSRIGVLVALKGGSPEVARDVAMHVAAVNPQFTTPAEVPAEVIEKEKEILTAQAQDSGKPAEIIEKMIGGRIQKFLAEISLSEQAFVKDPDVTVGKMVKAAGAELAGFVRFEVGEGIEKEEKDFAQEVAEQLANK
ncbi:MAG TPA: translation elongation factor Ts [Pseudomonadales bacterium]